VGSLPHEDDQEVPACSDQKPSHYDNDGYVIRWWRGGLPSNSLACLYGIALECGERQVLGADFDIDIDAIDETNWKVGVEDLTRSIEAQKSKVAAG
jgi:hypothetical protein